MRQPPRLPRLRWLAIALVLPLSLPAQGTEARRLACTVLSITDGDTFRCAGGRRVRLLLIDAPETGQGSFGRAATSALRKLLSRGDHVMLELDVEERDRYGRTLAYVFKDSLLVNEEMARQGYAIGLIYPPNVKYVERIRAAVMDASRANRGLWSVSAFECQPRDRRARRC